MGDIATAADIAIFRAKGDGKLNPACGHVMVVYIIVVSADVESQTKKPKKQSWQVSSFSALRDHSSSVVCRS